MKSIVDTNPDFTALNPGLRDGIRESETGLREIMVTFLEALPEELRPFLAGIVEEFPRRFLLTQLELYKEFDGHQRRLEEAAQVHLRLLEGNPAGLQKQ